MDHDGSVTLSSVRGLGEITPRSVLLGTLACALVAVWMPFATHIIGASRMNLSQLPVGAFGFFFAVVILNSLVGRISPGFALKPAEVLVVLVMVFIATVTATADLLEWVFGLLGPPYYLATPENRWMYDLWPYLKRWAVVQGPSEELRWAFVGMPQTETIPWGIWFIPTFWWLSFVIAVGLASICLAAILRKQWDDNERLAFPLMQAPLEIVSNPGGRHGLPAMLRSRAFWIGAAIPSFIIGWNIIGYFSPLFPRFTLADELPIKLVPNSSVDILIKVNLYVVGFAYMVNTDVLFSVWMWHLIVNLQRVVLERVGYALGVAGDAYGAADALTSWQGFGAFIVFVVIGLWMGRFHLWQVWLAFLGRTKADDERELLPWRWAVIGLVAAAVYIGAFLANLGMSVAMVLVYLFSAFVAYLGTTRVIAQTGLVYTRSPLTPPMFTFNTFGALGVPAQELVGMVGMYSLVGNGRGPLMPAIFHMSWLGARLQRSGRRMFTVTVVALVTALVVGSVHTIYESYMSGSTTWLAIGYANRSDQLYGAVVKKMQERTPVDTGSWLWLAIGAGVMTVLSVVQYRVPGWPLHPIGFPIAATWHVYHGFLSIFIVWLIKTVLMRVGGVEAYDRAKPVFLGIVAGYALGVVLSFVVDWLWFPGAGHQIHNW